MSKHVMAITYEPKIQPVLDGRCTQSIRKGRRFKVGDEILLHGWEGRPYRSKWSWRKNVVVKEIIDIYLSLEGLSTMLPGNDFMSLFSWCDTTLDIISILDFVDPPTGEALRDVLFGLNGAPTEPTEYQIIRWIKIND